MLETILYSVETTFSAENTAFYCQNYRFIFKLFYVEFVMVRISVYIYVHSIFKNIGFEIVVTSSKSRLSKNKSYCPFPLNMLCGA